MRSLLLNTRNVLVITAGVAACADVSTFRVRPPAPLSALGSRTVEVEVDNFQHTRVISVNFGISDPDDLGRCPYVEVASWRNGDVRSERNGGPYLGLLSDDYRCVGPTFTLEEGLVEAPGVLEIRDWSAHIRISVDPRLPTAEVRDRQQTPEGLLVDFTVPSPYQILSVWAKDADGPAARIESRRVAFGGHPSSARFLLINHEPASTVVRLVARISSPTTDCSGVAACKGGVTGNADVMEELIVDPRH